MEGAIPYNKYLETRDEMLPTLNSIYVETEPYSSPTNTPNVVESPQSPPTPPPYEKVSPTVIQ